MPKGQVRRSKRTTERFGAPTLRRSPRHTALKAEEFGTTSIKLEEFSTQERPTQEPTPPSSPHPTTTAINQRSDRLESKYTGSVPYQHQDLGNSAQCQEPSESISTVIERTQQPTVNWDCVSFVVSDQKVQTSYEKPEMSPPQVDSSGNPIPSSSRVQAYGKMVTKTVTVTMTTTIATTEILRPGEEGYEESLERQKRQTEQGPEEKQKQERQYRESRKWANGDRTMHENYHYTHHRAAQPAPSNTA